MLTIRNRKNQPFTFHMKDGKSLYLSPKGSLSIANNNLSDELTKAQERGLVAIQDAGSSSSQNEAEESSTRRKK